MPGPPAPLPARPRLLGAVLAGGRASRFGSDKAVAAWRGQSLLDHAAAALGRHVETVAICGRGAPGRLALADRPAPGLGPLGGLAAALHHAAAYGYDAVLATGCDMPLFPDALAAALTGAEPAILAGQPLAGCWPARLAAALDAFVAGDRRRSIRGWAESCGARILALPELALPNVNTPADLAALAGD